MALSIAHEPTREEDDSRKNHVAKRTPLPWAQLSIVCLIQFAEPISALVIYPFINQFVRETGIIKGDERKTGYFAGIVEATFFLAESIAVVPWGMASDRYGRRPVLLLGPLGLAIAMVGFGMSSQFWSLVLFRWLQGTCNGNIGVTKSVIDEITDSTNVADAFAVLPVVWMAGVTIGPFIGGFLARPATRWPNIFGNFEYFQKHPYLLPCLVASLFSFIVFILAAMTLKETLPSVLRRQRQRLGSDSTTTLIDEDVAHYGSTETRRIGKCREDITCPTSLPDLLKSRRVQIVLINMAFFGFCEMAIQSLTPLMWSTSVELGGLGFSSYQIGMVMGTYGVVNAFLQLVFLGKFVQRFGPRNAHILCFSSLLISILTFPVAIFFARRAGGTDWKVWTIVFISLVAQSFTGGAYVSLQILMTGSVSQSSLGTMNGLGQAVESGMRSLGPIVASSLHSLSLERQLAGGNGVYYIIAVIIACGIRFTFMLPRCNANL